MSQPRSASADRDRKQSTENNNNDIRKDGGNRRSLSKSEENMNSGSTLYISNLARRFNEEVLKEKFEKFGKVQDFHVVKDPSSEDSRGFGFVTYSNIQDAKEALEALSKFEFDGRPLKVEIARRAKGH